MYYDGESIPIKLENFKNLLDQFKSINELKLDRLIIDTSSQQILNNSSRISAIRELIETEQRYVNDLRTVANEFIKPLSNGRVLNDYEIEQLFSNWFS